MEIRVDRRRLVIGSAPEAEAIAEREIVWMREHAVVLAQALERIERERSYLHEGHASAVDWAVRRKMDRRHARELLRLGRLMAHLPDAADEVATGQVTPQAAAAAGRLVPGTPAIPPAQPPDPLVEEQQRREAAALAQQALDRSKEVSPTRFRSEVAATVEELAQGERLVHLSFHVKECVRDAWRRARKLATRRAGHPLTEGESFEAVTIDYLDRHDPLWKEPRARRVGPTSELPDDRYVPAEVRRDVTVRAQDHCEFPGCSNGVFLQDAHGRSHRRQGDRETGNLEKLCTVHHTMQEAGLIRLLRRTAAGATYVHTRTGEVFEPDPRIDAADPLPERERHGRGTGQHGVSALTPPEASQRAASTASTAPTTTPGAAGQAARARELGRKREREFRRTPPPDGVSEPRPPPWLLQTA